MVGSDEPNSFVEEEHSLSWRKEMVERWSPLRTTRPSHWHLPPRHRAIGLKCFPKVKRDEHRTVAKHKARLMVK